MENQEAASESGASFADSQYDMLDDMSEISTDDHETASITSHEGHDGTFTPEQTASDVEAEEHTLDFEPLSSDATVTLNYGARSSHLKQTKAENELIDSYMSDDLETPRQSIVAPMTVKEQANHILFFSDSSTSRDVKDSICGKVAASMNRTKADDSAQMDVVRLPATPTGICPPSAVVNEQSIVVATVQYCVGAENVHDGYKLRIVDTDEEHTSFFTIGENGKIDLMKPQIAVFYISESTSAQEWTDAAYAAMHSVKVPILVVHGPLNHSQSASRTSNNLDLSLDAAEFAQMDRPELSGLITALMSPSRTSTPKKRTFVKRSDKVNRLTSLFAMVKNFASLTHLLLVAVVAVSVYQFSATMMTNPQAQLTLRRESLAMVLESVTGSINATKDYNIEYLLPSPFTNCTSSGFIALVSSTPLCKPTSHYQVDSSNRFIISIEPVPSTLKSTSTKVYRSDGKPLAFNQSQLISGVYQVIISEDEAYGIITVNMVTKHPDNNIVACHNFGNRMLHLKTYEKATTDVSKVVSKDVAVIRNAARSFSSKLQSELGAGLSATKNVTSLIALSMTRELQVVAAKAAKARNQTMTAITKELVAMRKDIVQLPGDIKAKAKKTAISILKAPAPRLRRARHNLALIKILLRRPFEKKTPPATKPQKNSMLTDLSTTVKGASDQFRRDLDRVGKSLLAAEDASSKALRAAKREIKETNKQLSAARKSLDKELSGSAAMKGHSKQLKKLAKDVKEREKEMKQRKEEMQRLGKKA
jgi:hypothetical protein